MTISNNLGDIGPQSYREAGTNLTAIAVETSAATTVLTRKVESGVITWAALTTGAVGTHPLATVTGVVAVTCFAKVITDVAGLGTVEVGTALSTAGLLAQVAGTTLDADELWHDATPDSSLELDSILTKKIISQNIGVKITTDTLSGGTMNFYISWYPISSDGNLVIVSPFA